MKFLSFFPSDYKSWINAEPFAGCKCYDSISDFLSFGVTIKSFSRNCFFLFTDKITSQQIYVVSVIALILLLMLISILLGIFIRRSPYEVRTSVEIFALLSVAAPWSITYLMGLNFGSFDTYLFIIALLIVVFLKHPYLRWGIPLLTLLAMAIHQGFFFHFSPPWQFFFVWGLSKLYKRPFYRRLHIIFCYLPDFTCPFFYFSISADSASFFKCKWVCWFSFRLCRL